MECTPVDSSDILNHKDKADSFLSIDYNRGKTFTFKQMKVLPSTSIRLKDNDKEEQITRQSFPNSLR